MAIQKTWDEKEKCWIYDDPDITEEDMKIADELIEAGKGRKFTLDNLKQSSVTLNVIETLCEQINAE